MKRKAVAPIIATLLMVAISVVGGILIFVFTQDFFVNTDISIPSITAIQIFGYDARDNTTIETHQDEVLTAVGGTKTTKLEEGDAIALYVRNTGSRPATIEDIKVYGVSYTLDTAATLSAIVPGNGKFALTVGETTTTKTNAIVNDGEEVTIIIRYDGTNGDVKSGRPVMVKITMSNGQIFTKLVQNGVRL